MDVRCEKCQTEYELDEARLKPGGVTVKCTNCGHTFKVRKRATTNVGTPVGGQAPIASPAPAPRSAPTPAPAPRPPRADSIFDEERPTQVADDEAPTTVERQWLLRLDNGEQKSCRELATLQQWIISGVVSRESLISRTGKTWKRLGDIADLSQYFAIADEARANRERSRPTPRPSPGPAPAPAPISPQHTLTGFAPQAAGGTILPDDDEPPTHRAPRGAAPTPPPVPTRVQVRTPALGSSATVPVMSPPVAPVPPGTVVGHPHSAPRAPATTPPPVPARRSPPAVGAPTPPPPVTPAPPVVPRSSAAPTPPPVPTGSRATAMWAHESIKAEPGASSTAPFVGNLSAVRDEPAFAGKVRITPGAESSFETGRITLEDDDDVLPVRRGSRAGMIVLVMALVVMGAAAAGVYMFVIRGGRKDQPVASAPKDAAVAVVVPDAAVVAQVVPDAAVAPAEPSPLDAARAELRADVEARLRTAAQALDGKPDAPSLALRAHLIAQVAQDLIDRASVTTDKAAADDLRKDAKQLVLDAATAAQRALKAAADDAGANLAMAEVLRLQGKPAHDGQRYLDAARAKNDKDWARDLALADALALQRDGKLDDAKAAFAAIDQGDGKLEASGDVRARLHEALVLAAQGKAGDAKPLVDAILAAQPEHAAARALGQKLETQVATGDAMPPEEGKPPAPPVKEPTPTREPAGKPARPEPVREPSGGGGGGGSYDALLTSANKIADTNCGKAMELYQKALEQKPNGVEALTGMGFCYIDAKQFSSAHSKFRTALMVSPKYEPALRGIAEGYLQQGLKDRAIEAYKAYLDVYPDNALAKKQLERLGGSTAPAPAPAPSAPPPAPSSDQPQKAAPPPSSDGQPQKAPATDSPGPTTSPSGSGQ